MKYLCFFVALVIVSCSKPEKYNTQIQLSVNGLKKGKLYLQRIDENNKLQNLDSLNIEQPEASYLLQTNTTAPELMYVYLNKSDGVQYNDRIAFFAEPGNFTITTDVYSFEENAEITGGEHQRLFAEFNAMMDKFNRENVEILKLEFTEEEGEIKNLDEIQNRFRANLKRRYLYTLNFAHSHINSPVSAFVLTREAFDVGKTTLDSIYSKMPEHVQSSFYGKQLKEVIESNNEETLEM